MLLDLLPRLVDKTGRVLIADPGRSPAEEFLERAAAGRWHVRTTASRAQPRVRIHRLRRAESGIRAQPAEPAALAA